MKRSFALLLSSLLIFALALPCMAAGDSVRLDTALSDAETQNLDTLHQLILDSYGIDACFLINYDYEGGDAFKSYAKDFLNANAQRDDALVFAVSGTTYYLNTKGRANDLLEEGDMDSLYAAIRDADEAGEQYNAAAQFYAALNSLLATRVAAAAPETTTAKAFEEATTEATSAAQAQPQVIVPGSVPIPDKISPVRGDRLVDQADLLTPEEETALRAKLDSISEELQFDVVLVTAEQIGSRTPMEFADDYFDYNGFGYGDTHDGCAFLISMAERDWWISTCGFGITALSDDYFMDIVRYSKVISKLKDGDYNASFNAYADMVNDFVREAQEGEPYSSEHRYQDLKNKVIGICISLVIGLIVGGIVTAAVRYNYVASVQTQGEAAAYMVGKLNITRRDDHFRSSTVDRTERKTESSSSSSSGSSSSGGTHTSSSGYTHGGGGGKF